MTESSTHTDILVVAAPNEAHGVALADALRQLGRNVTLATTPESAAQATNYAGTIVVLTPATKDNPTVQAAINAQPSRMVGFFPEPMILPFGKWSNDPVLLRDSLTDAATRLIAAVDAPPQADVAAAARIAREQAEARATQRQRITLSIVSAIGVVLAVLIVIVLRGGDTSTITSSSSSTTADATPTAAPLPPYTTNFLGKGANCKPTTGATWKAGPSPLTVTCDKTGTLLTVPTAITARQFLSFVPSGGVFDTGYEVSVKATFETGDANVYAFIGVLGQKSNDSQLLCAVNAAGMWQVGEVDAKGALNAAKTGTTKAQKSVTLDVTLLSDNLMSCSINGNSVKPLPASGALTSASTAKIFVGMYDLNSTGGFSVHFTAFNYNPSSNS